ncbi:MAG: hypothetical protein UU16_C0004G0032 [Candidatus Woesebacteria bacterium GW2011_GWA2_40_7]|uniref:Uncharacterized protein n=3 Tax=Candidatus Woeseibacteriota TaxID=1752722 RepID=A0A0G0XX18_9BACT|nr:MAG: hypothetical protein UT17_C0002G0187 [Candidatus Woesebacteria bacterium GW2011_GWB1_39_10]KKR74208.1 MAG: hypothetical protein UU16_C0004G0032 [Candidatus Woesebacteria bacterium GW2011_GWA2_40_7]KKR92462.1 MAG: hypothetical protein UU42_C0001G0066 [Candidatus Woesebacteria bacterium GW2011_GWA1_41_13b]
MGESTQTAPTTVTVKGSKKSRQRPLLTPDELEAIRLNDIECNSRRKGHAGKTCPNCEAFNLADQYKCHTCGYVFACQ